MQAVAWSQPGAACELLAAGAVHNARDASGMTPLHWVAPPPLCPPRLGKWEAWCAAVEATGRLVHGDCLGLLLRACEMGECGACLSAANAAGQTPLLTAALAGFKTRAATDRLIAAGADAEALDATGRGIFNLVSPARLLRSPVKGTSPRGRCRRGCRA